MSSLFMDMLDAYEEIANVHSNQELKDMVTKLRSDRSKNNAKKRSSWYKNVNGITQETDVNADIKYITEALEDYKITYYLSTATAERRPETLEDVENDWKEETFAADSDYDALLYALELIDNGYDDTDFSTAEQIVQYFDEKDLGDGSPFVVKLEGPNGVIYDMGQTKDDFIEQVKENDNMLAYYRKVLGIDESLNKGNLDILNVEKDDNKMNEDMSVRAKLKALYPELDFGDNVKEAINESVDPDMFAELQEYAEDADDMFICYDSEYADYINELYMEAVDKLEKEFTDLFIEPSIQGIAGAVFANYNADDGAYEASWEFEDELEFLDSIILSATSEEDYINQVANYIREQLKNASLVESLDSFDDDMDFDIDESHETRLMSSLYEGSDDFDEYDDEAYEELEEAVSKVSESDEERGKYIWKISFDTASGEYEATNDVDDIYAHGATLKDCIEDLKSLVNELGEMDGSAAVKKFSDKHVDYSESDLDNLGYVIVKYGRPKFW